MTLSTETSQFLTFKLEGELFALGIAKVREVLEYSVATKVPRMPEFVQGVINLRGTVVPVVDVKLRLGLPPTQRTVDTCIVITEVDIDGETTVLGALADSVQEVVDLDPSQIGPPPRMGSRVAADCLQGMGKRDNEFVMLLDIDRVLGFAELQMPMPPDLAQPDSSSPPAA